MKKLFNVFFFTFIFSMINREFTPFGIDFRIIATILSLALIISFIITKKKIVFNSKAKVVILFYAVCLFSNIFWPFNGLHINEDAFRVILFSYFYNLLSFFTCLLYSDLLIFKKFYAYLNISLAVLLVSMTYCSFVGDLPLALSQHSGRILDVSPNFLGGKYRIAGFSQDANYASLFLVLGIAINIYQFLQNRKLRLVALAVLYMFFYLLAASKTILVAAAVGVFYLIIPDKAKKFCELALIFAIVFLPIFIVVFSIPVFSNNVSMTQRLAFWDSAKNLFLLNPLFGSGLTSFRSFFQETAYLGWYVQCHSTIFQILSENGLVAFICFISVIRNIFRNNNKLASFLLIIFMIFMANTETLYHAYSIFFLGIFPIIASNHNKNQLVCAKKQ